MDAKLIRIFQDQASLQCQFIFLADEYLHTRGLPNGDLVATYFAIQSLLGAAALLRRTLWGQDTSDANKRIELRESLEIGDDSPINDPKVRNRFEHYDQFIEKWWNKPE